MEQRLKTGQSLQGGTYRIEKVLGQGSFGITYLATTTTVVKGKLGEMKVESHVALKEFFMSEINSRKSDGSTVKGSTGNVFTNYRKKFKREAENLAKLSHPNIVKVFDVFDENNTTYYVMEYLEGTNLDDYIAQKGSLSENEAISITQEIGDALSYMHSHKMLHLDIKPKNIMRKPDGTSVLIDFGLAKQYTEDDEPESSTSIGLGTPGYAPLEQSSYKQDGTFPSTLDVYALGATLFKMLTGQRPPEASIIMNDSFPEEKFIGSGITQATIETVMKAMNPMKRQRYQSVLEISAALKTESAATFHISHNDILQYGISVFSITEDEKLQIYYRGRVYLSNRNAVSIDILNKCNIDSALKDISGFLHTKTSEHIDFERYWVENRQIIYNSSANIVTYCSDKDFLSAQRFFNNSNLEADKFRFSHEMQLIPLSFNQELDGCFAFEYQNLYCEAEIGDGIFEILQSGLIDNKEDYLKNTIAIRLSDLESFVYLLFGALSWYHVFKGNMSNMLLLQSIPFNCSLEIWIDGRYRDGDELINNHTTIPTRKSFMINDENCSIFINFLSTKFALSPTELFGYSPQTTDLTIDINERTAITFTLMDKDKNKSITIPLYKLMAYEIKNNNETTILY